jgi:phosphoglycerol transferase MdoB-like AlkP superfamily enzyme
LTHTFQLHLFTSMKINNIPKWGRSNEFLIFLYRILLVYLFYFISRVLFTIYNLDLIQIKSFGEFIRLAYYGLPFDTTAIIYINLLFIVLSILPLVINTSKVYQKFLFYIYFITNLLAISTNFVDFAYYRFNMARSMSSVLETLQHESNKLALFVNFLKDYWDIFLLFFGTSTIWIYLYKIIKLKPVITQSKINYFLTSTVVFLFISLIAVAGVRGDFKKSTRPINLVDANKHIQRIELANVVLNTPFSIIRTIGMDHFKKVNYVDNKYISLNIKPIKHYQDHPVTKPNIVIFIMESFGREYIGAFNKNTSIPNFHSYTPFIDSLAEHSLIFTNAYANGYKSIHAMAAVLAGIPSFKTAYTSSYYPNQSTQSLVSILNDEGYDTSFFHGAPNGSMGFSGFANILGFKHYYGKTEYDNNADFDGVWAIWDEPFMQYMCKTLSKKTSPFMATLFSASSHDPFKIPKKYDGRFPKGTVNIHQCIGYSDYALKRFFNEAAKQKWFKNTIFVIVADHCNTKAYDEYKKGLNISAVPILFYKPDNSLRGEMNQVAQQIDIYPTLIDIIGYQKPFRSWGNSLTDPESRKRAFYIGFSGTTYNYVQGNYICQFDGKKSLGFYSINDKQMTNNQIEQPTDSMKIIEKNCKAFLQDYFERIVDHKLNPQDEIKSYNLQKTKAIK